MRRNTCMIVTILLPLQWNNKGLWSMKVSEVVRLLIKAGCYIYRNGANHDIWFSPKTGKKFPVSRHQTEELKPKTLESIKKGSGI